MKKTLLLLLVAMSVSLSGFAQKGRQAVGVDVPFRINWGEPSLGVGLKYQYNVSDYVCIEPVAQYYFLEGDYAWLNFIAMLNSKFFFIQPNRFRPYGLIGAGVCNGSFECWDGCYGDIHDEFSYIIQAGFGLDYRLSYDWSWQLEFGYHINDIYDDDDHSGFYISTGITYNF